MTFTQQLFIRFCLQIVCECHYDFFNSYSETDSVCVSLSRFIWRSSARFSILSSLSLQGDFHSWRVFFVIVCIFPESPSHQHLVHQYTDYWILFIVRLMQKKAFNRCTVVFLLILKPIIPLLLCIMDIHPLWPLFIFVVAEFLRIITTECDEEKDNTRFFSWQCRNGNLVNKFSLQAFRILSANKREWMK